jgi:AraC family transcriptional regulator
MSCAAWTARLDRLARPSDARGDFIDQTCRPQQCHSIIGQTLRVSDLGDVVKLSTAHFSRVFKRSFGRGPHAYITQRRIGSAMALMRNSRLSLCDIAMECGFSDQSHFCRTFRQKRGVSPSTWRQQHTAHAGAAEHQSICDPRRAGSGGLRGGHGDGIPVMG